MAIERHVNQTALIIGGGIGGLATALSLAQQGFRIQLFEQAEAFSEVGAGIQLSPNATRVLFHLGMGEALAEVAFLPEAMLFRQYRSGKTIARHALGTPHTKQYGYPYYHVHRADLIELLARDAQAHPQIRLHTHSQFDSMMQSNDEVSIKVNGEVFQGSVLIGADGIHSTVREVVFGPQKPSFTGNVAWRGLIDVSQIDREAVQPGATVWMGPGKHFVHYYVRGGKLLNCVCVVEKEGWELESWTTRGDLVELKQDFEGWHPDIQRLITAMDPERLFKWALYDRLPLSEWCRGRVCLLGDACHPTLPFMAQGAAMALEDAAVLSRLIQPGAAIPDQLKRFQKLRAERTAWIQSASRRNARVFHLSGPAATARNLALAAAGDRVMDKLYRYDALAVA